MNEPDARSGLGPKLAGAALVAVLVLIAFAAMGLTSAAGPRGYEWYEQPGAYALFGFTAAIALGLVARVMRMLLGRPAPTGESHADDLS